MTTVLVVAADPDLVRPLGSWLQAPGLESYTLRFAADRREALLLLDEDPAIELVLLDLDGPDGLALLGELPTRNALLRTVVLSAHPDLSTIRAAMNRGAFDFLSKPLDRAALESCLENAVRYLGAGREVPSSGAVEEWKRRFFDNITHEFRTPLTLILAPVHRLLHETLDPEALRWHLQTVEDNAYQLLRLINQLLELAKLESDTLELHLTPGDPVAFVGQVVQAFQPLAVTQRLTLHYEHDALGPYAFDAEKLGRVVSNLVMNGLKFTPEGGVTVTLRRTEDPAGEPAPRTDTLRLTVRDTGVGIVPQKVPHIFDRFYQANFQPPASRLTGTGEIQPGTGIGLALIKELVEGMGGTIAVRSTVRHPNGSPPPEPPGTTFTIELPLERVDPDRVPDALHLAGAGLPSDFGPGRTPAVPRPKAVQRRPDEANRPLVLVAEDNAQLRAFLTEVLADTYRVLPAADGLEAWALAQGAVPDVVVSDVMMPGMDGFELTQRLKSTPDTDHIPVILLTAKANHSSRLAGLTQGADEYLTKPFLADELLLRLRNLLTRQQRLREHERQSLSRPDGPAPLEHVADAFLRRVYAAIEARLDDSSLSVDDLAGTLAVSRKTLYRKVLSLTQLSPHDLLRRYRLRQSVELLRAGYPVSEAAYRVGFETPAYFGKCFREAYGFAPSELPGRAVARS
jgi:signal transduction histidine kinase/AraC-like DNA-binding protein